MHFNENFLRYQTIFREKMCHIRIVFLYQIWILSKGPVLLRQPSFSPRSWAETEAYRGYVKINRVFTQSKQGILKHSKKMVEKIRSCQDWFERQGKIWNGKIRSKVRQYYRGNSWSSERQRRGKLQGNIVVEAALGAAGFVLKNAQITYTLTTSLPSML